MAGVFFGIDNPSDIDKDWVGIKNFDQISNFEVGVYAPRNTYNYKGPEAIIAADDDMDRKEQVEVKPPFYADDGTANYDRMDPLVVASLRFEIDDDDVNDINVYRQPNVNYRYPGEGWSPYGQKYMK